jgi:outer membrane protein assembly factor BamB
MSTVHNRRWVGPVLLIGALAAAAGPEWAGFRGSDGSGVSAEKGLPVKWGKETGLRYKVALPGRGLSNPVVAGGKIYVTACSGYKERRLHVLCLEEATGKKLWERQFTATGSTACHPTSSMAAPTPVTDGKAVYALFATGDLAALSAEGTLLWYRSLVGDYPDVTNQVGMAASPALAGDVLLLAMENAGDSFTAGLDKRTGKNLWKKKRERDINWVTPLVLGPSGKEVLFSNGTEAAAVDPADGKVRWSYKASLSTISSPAQGDGMVYVVGGPGSETLALRPSQAGGAPELVWKSNKLTPGFGTFASPVYSKGRLYGLTAAALLCLDGADGKEVWRQRVEGPFWGSPVIADGKLYAVNTKGRTFVVQLGDKPKLLARNDLEDTINATPAVANGRIYLRSDKFLYCIGPKG